MDDGLEDTEAAVVVWGLRSGALLLRDGAGVVGQDEEDIASSGTGCALAAGSGGEGEAGGDSSGCAHTAGIYGGDGRISCDLSQVAGEYVRSCCRKCRGGVAG